MSDNFFFSNTQIYIRIKSHNKKSILYTLKVWKAGPGPKYVFVSRDAQKVTKVVLMEFAEKFKENFTVINFALYD